jgi:hypothetical protein
VIESILQHLHLEQQPVIGYFIVIMGADQPSQSGRRPLELLQHANAELLVRGRLPSHQQVLLNFEA